MLNFLVGHHVQSHHSSPCGLVAQVSVFSHYNGPLGVLLCENVTTDQKHPLDLLFASFGYKTEREVYIARGNNQKPTGAATLKCSVDGSATAEWLRQSG